MTLLPTQGHCQLLTSLETLKDPQVGWPIVLWSHYFAFGPSPCEILWLPSKIGLYFSQSYEAPELKPYWPLKPNGLEAWCGAQNSLLWENLCSLIIFQFLSHFHLVGMRYYYIATVPLLSCCGFCFIFCYRKSFFTMFQTSLINDCSVVSCVLMFDWEEVGPSPPIPSTCHQSS